MLRAARAHFALTLARAKIYSNTGALPQPPSGELAPLNPRRAAEYVRAIRVYALRTLQKRIFHISPLTQYILDPIESDAVF